MFKKIKFICSQEIRKTLSAVVGQVGLARLAKTIIKARENNKTSGLGLVHDYFLAFWDSLGDREAIIDGESRISFSDFRIRVLKVSDMLFKFGLKEGDACAVLLNNGSSWFEICQACNLMGVSMPMLNWHLKPAELVHCVNRSSAKVLVLDVEFLAAVLSVRAEMVTVEDIVVIGLKDSLEGVHQYEKLLEDAKSVLHPGKFHISTRAYSGGTTGTPKFINTNQEALFGESDKDRRGASKEEAISMAVKQLASLGWYGLGSLHDKKSGNVRSLIPGPLYHAGVQLAVLPFLFGGTVVPMRKFSPESFLKNIQDERISWTFVAPTMLERILALPSDVQKSYDLSSMKTLICAAAPCPSEVKKNINTLFRKQGAKKDIFHEYYGATETGLITILLPEDYKKNPERYNSVGKVRAAECKIFNNDTKKWCKPGVEGKVLLRSALTFGLNYTGEKEKTDECYQTIDNKIWYDDGLIGYLDKDDFLFLTSREKEMIISGGVNLYPNEIEEIIKRHDAVLDVAVVRAPDPDLGEVPAAIIQLKDGYDVSDKKIIQHCKDLGLYGFKIPKLIEFDSLPRNIAGKLPKKEIEERFWKGVKKIG